MGQGSPVSGQPVTVTTQPTRTVRSAAVRDSVLSAAKTLFTRAGYDATGIRDIAALAGVNPAIVIRHFGSKDQLFLEAIDGKQMWDQLTSGPLESLGERIARGILRGRRGGLRAYGVLIRASGRPEVQRSLQDTITTAFADELADRLPGENRHLRAHLFTAQVIGLMTALVVYEDVYLLTAPTELLATEYGRSLQATLNG